MSRGVLYSPDKVEIISSSMGRMAGGSFGPKREKMLLGSDSFPSVDCDDMDDLREEDVWGDDSVSWENKEVCAVHLLREAKTTPLSEKVSTRRRSWLALELQKNEDKGDHFLSSESSDGGYQVGRQDHSFAMYIPQFNHGTEFSNGWDRSNGVPQSAPVGVQAWEDAVEEGQDGDEFEEEEEGGDGVFAHGKVRLPPHEVVARQYAKSQATTFSVFEGTGRTLKGMDLRRVRNAVWRRTGFVD